MNIPQAAPIACGTPAPLSPSISERYPPQTYIDAILEATPAAGLHASLQTAFGVLQDPADRTCFLEGLLIRLRAEIARAYPIRKTDAQIEPRMARVSGMFAFLAQPGLPVERPELMTAWTRALNDWIAAINCGVTAGRTGFSRWAEHAGVYLCVARCDELAAIPIASLAKPEWLLRSWRHIDARAFERFEQSLRELQASGILPTDIARLVAEYAAPHEWDELLALPQPLLPEDGVPPWQAAIALAVIAAFAWGLVA